jgi:hypothetical protein
MKIMEQSDRVKAREMKLANGEVVKLTEEEFQRVVELFGFRRTWPWGMVRGLGQLHYAGQCECTRERGQLAKNRLFSQNYLTL